MNAYQTIGEELNKGKKQSKEQLKKSFIKNNMIYI